MFNIADLIDVASLQACIEILTHLNLRVHGTYIPTTHNITASRAVINELIGLIYVRTVYRHRQIMDAIAVGFAYNPDSIRTHEINAVVIPVRASKPLTNLNISIPPIFSACEYIIAYFKGFFNTY